MAAKIYAVLDTNVLVSGMFTGKPSSTTRQILDLTLEGAITPLINKEIVDEYSEVLSRDKFPFRPEDVSFVVDAFKSIGIDPGRTAAKDVNFPDPKEPIVVTPVQMLEIIHDTLNKEE